MIINCFDIPYRNALKYPRENIIIFLSFDFFYFADSSKERMYLHFICLLFNVGDSDGEDL